MQLNIVNLSGITKPKFSDAIENNLPWFAAASEGALEAAPKKNPRVYSPGIVRSTFMNSKIAVQKTSPRHARCKGYRKAAGHLMLIVHNSFFQTAAIGASAV
jgi:hypothetical protein